ncbi:hypothetical protein PCE1_002728 [Barthelona sp. PCE]
MCLTYAYDSFSCDYDLPDDLGCNEHSGGIPSFCHKQNPTSVPTPFIKRSTLSVHSTADVREEWDTDDELYSLSTATIKAVPLEIDTLFESARRYIAMLQIESRVVIYDYNNDNRAARKMFVEKMDHMDSAIIEFDLHVLTSYLMVSSSNASITYFYRVELDGRMTKLKTVGTTCTRLRGMRHDDDALVFMFCDDRTLLSTNEGSFVDIGDAERVVDDVYRQGTGIGKGATIIGNAGDASSHQLLYLVYNTSKRCSYVTHDMSATHDYSCVTRDRGRLSGEYLNRVPVRKLNDAFPNQPVFIVSVNSSHVISTPVFGYAGFTDAAFKNCPDDFWPRLNGGGVLCSVRRSFSVMFNNISDTESILDFDIGEVLFPEYDFSRAYAFAAETLDPVVPKNQLWQKYFKTGYRTTVVVVTRTRIHFVGIQAKVCDMIEQHVRVLGVSTVAFMPLSVKMTPNTHFVFVAMRQIRHMAIAESRINTICQVLDDDPLNVFLQVFRDTCDSYSKPDIYYHLGLVSKCIGSSYCDSFVDRRIVSPPGGYYLASPGAKKACPSGYYCSGGSRRRCSVGTICPNERMSSPDVCDFTLPKNLTCAATGLKEPKECPDGFVCLAPYLDPIPAPAGYFAQNGTLELCTNGSYCPLGLNESFPCPAGTYCSHVRRVTPKFCSLGDYCPDGSVDNVDCPAGFMCLDPTKAENCTSGYHCPNASIIESYCQPGYYCPTPAEELDCPEGYYCRTASTKPKKCPFYASCPKNSFTPSATFFGFVLEAIIATAFLLMIYLVLQLPKIFKPDISEIATQRPRRQGYPIVINNLQVCLNRKRFPTILHPMSMVFPNNCLTCIMGCSGAGKTTLLNFIVDKLNRSVYEFDDSCLNHRISRSEIGYVPQENIVHPELTVRQMLLFSAKLRLPRGTSMKEIQTIVNDVLHTLRLEGCADTVCGSVQKKTLSGGQLRRVVIGCELVTLPRVLVGDEVTSGLDSFAALEIMRCLKRISMQGITVITTLHQPRFEILKLTDRLVLLSQGGYLIYDDDTSKALEYFETIPPIQFKCPKHCNPADFYLDIASCEKCESTPFPIMGTTLAQLWQQHSHQNYETIARSLSSYPKPSVRKLPTRLRQFIVMMHKSLIQVFKKRSDMVLNFVFLLFSAFIMGIVVLGEGDFIGPLPDIVVDKCPGPLKFVCSLPRKDPFYTFTTCFVLAAPFIGVVFGTRTFATESVIMKQRCQSGVSVFAYWLAKNIIHSIELLFFTLVFVILIDSITGTDMELQDTVLLYYGLIFTFAGIGYTMSFVFSEAVNNLASVVSVILSYVTSGMQPPRHFYVEHNLLYVLYFTPLYSCINLLGKLYMDVIPKDVDIGSFVTIHSLNLEDIGFYWWQMTAHAVGHRILSLIVLQFTIRRK